MSNVKMGYGGRVIKAEKEAYIGIHRDVAKLMIKSNICIAFDVNNRELTFVHFSELGSEKPKFPGLNQTNIGKKLIKKDGNTPIKSNSLFLKPFKILMSSEADNFFKSKGVFWAHGKINKSKNFQLDGIKTEENLKDVKNPIENFREILGKETIWCLCPKSMEKRSLAATNPKDVESLTPEEQKKCELYISIMKSELANLNDVPYFKESCELASSNNSQS